MDTMGLLLYVFLKNYFIEKIIPFTDVIVSVTEETTVIIGPQHGFIALW